jgi:hypothetical protein
LETNDYNEDMRYEIQKEGDRRSQDFSSQFRIVPTGTALRLFLTAFAIAASNMIALREAALWCPLNEEDEHIEAVTEWLPENTPYDMELLV